MTNPPHKDPLPCRPIQLRPPFPSDMQYIRSLWGDQATMEPVGGPIDLTAEQSAEWFRRVVDPGNPGECYRLICNESGAPVGEISYHRMDFDTMTAELNIKIESRFRKRGYGRSAMREFLDFYFVQQDGRALVDDVASANVAGQRLLESFGFEMRLDAQQSRRYILTRERFTARYPSGNRDRDNEA